MEEDEIELFDDDMVVISESDLALNRLLHNNSSENYMLISSYLPEIREIDRLVNTDCYYKLIKRSGFINSSAYHSSSVKKKQVYMISSGSLLNYKPKGRVADLNINGNHSIYLHGKPIVMGVNI